MRIGYIRVSTDEQTIERQEKALKAAGVEKIFIDKLSGKNMARPGLQELLAYIRDGDIVIVESYSRLARSLKDLINIIDEIKNKKADFYSIKENSDTSSAAGKLIMNIFGALYEFERECLLERQKEGIEIAKAAGKYKGRKPIKIDDDSFMQLYDSWIKNEIKTCDFMKKFGLKPSTFYRKINKIKKQV